MSATYHLGDLVGYAPWPNETVELIRARGIAGVAGNYDSTVGTDYKHCGCRYEDPRQEELSHLSYDWTRQHVSPQTKEFLGGLPFRIDLLPKGGHLAGPRVVLVHGTPTLNTLYWTEDRPDDFCLKMASHAGSEAGRRDRLRPHPHALAPGGRRDPFRQHRQRGAAQGRRLAGGVCAAGRGRGAVKVEFVRVEYDLEGAMRAIRKSELPDEFAEYLRTGGRLKPRRRPAVDGSGRSRDRRAP